LAVLLGMGTMLERPRKKDRVYSGLLLDSKPPCGISSGLDYLNISNEEDGDQDSSYLFRITLTLSDSLIAEAERGLETYSDRRYYCSLALYDFQSLAKSGCVLGIALFSDNEGKRLHPLRVKGENMEAPVTFIRESSPKIDSFMALSQLVRLEEITTRWQNRLIKIDWLAEENSLPLSTVELYKFKWSGFKKSLRR